jgi:DNA replication protein DnaC
VAQFEVSSELRAILGELKLGKLVPTLPERLRQARERGMDPEDVLLMVLSDEVERRRNQRVSFRAERAHLSRDLVFDAWDAGARITYDHELLNKLRTLRFFDEHHHVLIMGPVGVGKTMLANALGHLANERGFTVLCESSDRLFARLRGARLDGTYDAELRRLVVVQLLIIDDLALRPLDGLETNDLYEIVTARHRTASMVITSNRDPQEWLALMGDPLHAQALVDRFSNNAYDLVIEGESYRKRQKPQA